jgi:hypothetical protein
VVGNAKGPALIAVASTMALLIDILQAVETGIVERLPFSRRL